MVGASREIGVTGDPTDQVWHPPLYLFISSLHGTQPRDIYITPSAPLSYRPWPIRRKPPTWRSNKECCKLHDQKKWKDCIALCHHNLSDDSMPRFFVIKTLVLLTGAVDDWWRAEVREKLTLLLCDMCALLTHFETQEYRLAAENVFRKVQATQEASGAPPLSTDMEECMAELRQELDGMPEWQADDTPEHIANSPFTFAGTQVPPRPGSLNDLLQARRTKAEEEAREATDMEVEGVTEAGMRVDNGLVAEVPGEDRVDVDANVGGDEDRNRGDDNEYAPEDADGVKRSRRFVPGDVGVLGGSSLISIDTW